MKNELDIAPLSEWGFFTEPRPCVIAGPCSAETEEQVMTTARGLCGVGIHVFRAGIWKPRTHPGSFEGVGTPGLKWLKRVQRELGMKVGTEVASEKHVFECLKYGLDYVWIGARTTANPFLVQEIADALEGTDLPVLVKNPVNPDLDLWIGALERLARAGVRKLGIIHRGVSSSEKLRYRNNPQWQMAIELRRRCPGLPFFCDPSHMAGKREYIRELSQRSLDLGLEGLMVESHCDPSCALSDAAQQLTPKDLIEMLESLQVRESDAGTLEYREGIGQLRAQIDVLDENLLSTLAQRMEVSRRIGEVKKKSNVAILQTGRWDAVLAAVEERGAKAGLDKDFVDAVFNAIHEASVKVQNEILEK